MLKRMISLILTAVILTGLGIGVYAEEDVWSEYVMSGSEVKSDGTLQITSSGGVIANATKTTSVPKSYEFSATIKVDSFNNETGIQICNGQYRLFVKLNSGSIQVGGSNFSYGIGNTEHAYDFTVNTNKVDVYVDNNYMGTADMQSNTTAARIYFWALSSAGGTASMNVKTASLKENEAYVSPIKKPLTESFYQAWDNCGDWRVAYKNDVKTDEDGILNITQNKTGTVFSAEKHLQLSENFDYEFRLRVNAFGNGETGSKIEWNPYRIFFYFRENNLRNRSANGIVDSAVDLKEGDWHTYKAEIRGDKAAIYMDGIYVTSFNLEPYSLEDAIMTYWVKPSNDTTSSLSVDWTRYTPIDISLDMTAPKANSTFIEGASIHFNAVSKTETPAGKLTYYANGLPVAASDENGVWNDVPYGKYKIYAVDETGRRSNDISIEVIKGFGANISVPAYVDYADAIVADFTPYSFDGSTIEQIDCYFDGDYVGSENNCRIENAKIGMHTVYAVVKASNGVTMVTEKKPVMVTGGVGGKIEGAYTAAGTFGEGSSVQITDDLYRLQFAYRNGKAVYTDDTGEKTQALPAGRYEIDVDFGQALVYRDGKFEFSFLMPQAEGDNNILADGVDGFEITADEHHGNYYLRQSGEAEFKAQQIGFLTDYVVEFDKSDQTRENIALYDGAYGLEMTIDDKVKVKEAPLGTGKGIEEDILCDTPSGGGLYRIVVSVGIGQLFIDNRFAGAFRMPDYTAAPKMSRTLEREGATTFTALRKLEDVYRFYENFEQTSKEEPMDYWSGEGISIGGGQMELSGNAAALLNVSANNPLVKAKIKIQEEGKGKIHFFLRYQSGYANLRVTYDFKEGTWSIYEKYLKEELVTSRSGTLPAGEWIDIEIQADKKSLTLLCNGTEAVFTDKLTYIPHGRLGFGVEDTQAAVDEIFYSGDGRPNAGVEYQQFTDCHTVDFMENEDGSLYMMGAGSASLKRSSDGGNTWQTQVNTNLLSSNTLKLKNGNIVTIRRENGPEANTYWDEAKISYDGGQTFKGPYRVETRVSNRITMNNKLTELEDGRIIFCVGESGHGMEDYGALGIYYSDDSGVTWHESDNPLTIYNTGVNVQEGKIIELPDGTLRCYMRTDRGFIYTSDSHDRGKTWNTKLKKSQFAAPLNAMNIERDPYDGNTYYMFWEYDNKNGDPVKQQPRYRSALAVSHDGCETWEYVMDVQEFDDRRKVIRHANQGIRIFENEIYLNIVAFEPNTGGIDTQTNRVFRIDKDKIRTTKRFAALHQPFDIKLNGAYDTIENALIIPKNGNTALILGEPAATPQYQEGMVPVELFSANFGTTKTVENGKMTLSFGKTSLTVEESAYIPAQEAAKTFNKQLTETEHYLIIGDAFLTDNVTDFIDHYINPQMIVREE